MVVDNLDFICVPASPPKADSPLLVDPNTVLPTAISRQLLKAVRGRSPKIADGFGRIQDEQFSQRDPLESNRKPRRMLPLEHPLCVGAAETLNHCLIITRCANIVKRY
jgi:hypothetical protein